MELFFKKESVIAAILISIFVFWLVFLPFVLRVLYPFDRCDLWGVHPFHAFRVKVFMIRTIRVIGGESILLVAFVLRILRSVRSV